MIAGNTAIIAHIGFPTHTFKSPMIDNPYFEHGGVDAVVVPIGCKPEPFLAFLESVFTLENNIAGSCNAVRRDADGRLVGDMSDGFPSTTPDVPRSLAKLKY